MGRGVVFGGRAGRVRVYVFFDRDKNNARSARLLDYGDGARAKSRLGSYSDGGGARPVRVCRRSGDYCNGDII